MVAEFVPDEPGWRVQIGVGLVAHAPMSDAQRARFLAEEERERKALEFEAQSRRDAAVERRWDLQRRGVEPHSVGEVLQSAAFGMDRADAAERRREKGAAEELGQPEPRLNRWELKREQQQREAEAIITPASKADVSKLSQSITSLASKVGMLGRRRSAEQESPEEYARAYGGGIYFRNGGGYIVRGPY